MCQVTERLYGRSITYIMQNDAGEFVDLYVPRKCSASNRIIGAKDHASIQINIAEVDKVTGRFNGQFKTYAICGAIRRMEVTAVESSLRPVWGNSLYGCLLEEILNLLSYNGDVLNYTVEIGWSASELTTQCDTPGIAKLP
ncbi:40S ribosomal protein S21 [Bagarius yarrelli]|uniref:Small ribosomal subunit protein eS21 n=1 Tax=Bagarius yarrelli TaxID=175774 RepID=A0A556V2R7_BAGYA|nr:40S ribosomal protein S21 [Bagarius yarrelli]